MGWEELTVSIFLFGLVVGLAWFATRFVGLRMGAPGRGRILRVLEQVPAGRDRSILLLEAGDKLYLVGVTSTQIQLLDTIADGEAFERLQSRLATPTESPFSQILPGSFKEALAKVWKSPREEAPSQAADLDRLQEQIERLRRLQRG